MIENDIQELFLQHLKNIKNSTNGWKTASCPFHEDKKNSFLFNPTTGGWSCQAGCASLEIKRKPLYVRELPPALETKFIPMDLFAGSHSNYENNDLIKYCIEVFGEEEVVAMIEKYKVGTSSKGHMVYWYLTQYNEVCTGKIMKYVPGKGSRDRESNWSIDWVHRYVEGMTKENVKDVLYGRHLVQPSYLKPGTLIKVVESEASAMIMSIFEPNDVWIATGGQSGLKLDLFDFEGFHVVLYPDADATAGGRKSAKTDAAAAAKSNAAAT